MANPRSYVLVVLIFLVPTQAMAVCSNSTSDVFTETFDNSSHRDSANSIDGWGISPRLGQGSDHDVLSAKGSIRLRHKGGVFAREHSLLGSDIDSAHVVTVAPGDFNHDGIVDLMGAVDPSNGALFNANLVLRMFQNEGVNVATGSHLGFTYNPAPVAGISDTGLSGRDSVLLIPGDVNGDGYTDLLYLSATKPSQQGTLAVAKLFIATNTVPNSTPSFDTIDVFSALSGAALAWHIRGSPAVLSDFDKDGRDDLIFATSSGSVRKVLLFPSLSGSLGFGAPITLLDPINALATNIATAGSRPGAYPRRLCDSTGSGGVRIPIFSYGSNILMVDDFDNDADLDMIIGSASAKSLYLYTQISPGIFSSTYKTIPFAYGGPIVGYSEDLDGDGDIDFVVAREGTSCDFNEGSVWVFNNDGGGNFTSSSRSLAIIARNVSWMAVFDVNPDGDYLPDIIGGYESFKGRYTLMRALPADPELYVTSGQVVSKRINLGNNDAIAGVQLTNVLPASQPADTSIDYYVSNDSGAHWERLSPSELPPTSNIHYFSYFGNDLRWKAVLKATAAPINSGDALSYSQYPYAPTSKVTPTLSSLSFKYIKATPHIFSRSGLAQGKFSVGTTPYDYLFTAAFSYPSFYGYLSAYNINSYVTGSAPAATLEQVSSSYVDWESGALLASRSANTRVLYSYSTPGVMQSLTSLATSQPSLFGTSKSTEASSIVDFVAGPGVGASYNKFFDPGHSSPVLIAKPAFDANYQAYGASYSAFQLGHQNRTPMVYIGANDGMLHAFKAQTGDELWGFVPKNLLGKLASMRGPSSSYLHNNFVDGSITAADISTTGGWKSIVISGQAQGQSSDGNNYYFALDVTDPNAPKPLWEFTDAWGGSSLGCEGISLESKSCEANAEPAGTTVSSCETDPSVAQVPSYFAVPRNKFMVEIPAVNYSSYDGDPSTISTLSSTCSGSPVSIVSMQASNSLYYDFYFPPNSGSDNFFEIRMVAEMTPDQNNVFSFTIDDTWSSGGVAKPWSGTIPAGNNNFCTAEKFPWPTSPPSVMNTGFHRLRIYGNGSSSVLNLRKINIYNANGGDFVFRTTCTSYSYWEKDNGNISAYNSCADSTVYDCPSGNSCCSSPTGNFCSPNCATDQNDTVAGETWSPPLITRVNINGVAKWVTFFASGYNNRRGAAASGRSLYMLDAETGVKLMQWNFDDLAFEATTNPSTINNTIPGGASAVDLNGDGNADRLYFADLEGRVWKLEMESSNVPANWQHCLFFDAGALENGSGWRKWAPISSKPAIAIIDPAHPNVYFGTGGDDSAPSNIGYQFYSVMDTDNTGACRSTPRLVSELTPTNNEWVIAGDVGDRFWSDGVSPNNLAIYFSSLSGSVNSVDPCAIDDGSKSKLYGIAMQNFKDANGQTQIAGTSVFKDIFGNSVPWLNAGAKIRQAVLVRGAQPSGTVYSQASQSTLKKDIFVVEMGAGSVDPPAVRRLSAITGETPRTRVRILRWRELSIDN